MCVPAFQLDLHYIMHKLVFTYKLE